MIKVIIVDDSPTTRALLVRMLQSDPDVQVVGEAASGNEAVSLVCAQRPDVVVMDVNMPGIDGFEATKRIMNEAPTPVVIVSSAMASADVQMSFEALSAGAVHSLCKPLGPSDPNFEEETRRFVRTIKAMSQVKVVRRWPDVGRSGSSPAHTSLGGSRGASLSPTEPRRIVAMAASTGGPAALHRVLSALPSDFAAPILIVQHISLGFSEGLVRWLNLATTLTVKLAEDGEQLTAGTAYIAPEGHHLGVSPRLSVALSSDAPIHGFRPSATFLFRSVATVFRSRCVSVMLTGMGDDGVEGLRDVRRTGGRIVLQDEASCVIFGMPGAAQAAGLFDEVSPLDQIAPHLVDAVMSDGVARLSS